MSSLTIAVIVVLVLLLLAGGYYWMYTKYTVKLAVSNVAPGSSAGALTLTTTTKSTSDPSTWVGKKITLHTKSLGKIHSTVASATATSVNLPAGAYTGTATYTADASDHALITLKY